mgnify:CR=1 FL=1
MKRIILLLFLTSCSTQALNNQSAETNLKFNMDLSYMQYKNFLTKYNSISGYPDISN